MVFFLHVMKCCLQFSIKKKNIVGDKEEVSIKCKMSVHTLGSAEIYYKISLLNKLPPLLPVVLGGNRFLKKKLQFHLTP